MFLKVNVSFSLTLSSCLRSLGLSNTRLSSFSTVVLLLLSVP